MSVYVSGNKIFLVESKIVTQYSNWPEIWRIESQMHAHKQVERKKKVSSAEECS